MKDLYLKFYDFYEKHHLTNFIIYMTKYLPYLFYLSYPLCLIYVFMYAREKFLLVFLVPLGTFVLVTFIRKQLNFPRPYEVYDYTPILSHSEGKSFPSRHCACAWILALTYLYLSYPLGIATCLLAFVIAASRILAGLHFPKDVLVGSLLSLFIGYIFYFA